MHFKIHSGQYVSKVLKLRKNKKNSNSEIFNIIKLDFPSCIKPSLIMQQCYLLYT